MGRWIDISMAVTDGLRTNHSKPGEEVKISSDVVPEQDPQKRKTVRRIATRLHIGTHVDAPEHLVVGAKRIEQYPIDTFVGPAWVIDMYHKVPRGIITAADLDEAVGAKVSPNDIILVRTGWNSHYAEPEFFRDSPYFHPDAADWCIQKQLKIVAVDFLCDPVVKDLQMGDPDAFKVKVLAAGILVMTNADDLDQIKQDLVTLYAFPLKIAPSEAGLTRAVVWEE
jgi:kynurenine formamidase